MLFVLAACREVEQPARTTTASRFATPVAQDGEDLCADIGERRVCWRGAKAAIVPRVVPSVPATPHGFRCGGAGPERVCEDRQRNGSAFSCGTTRCLQERPRKPDDGEWECVELSGVVYCHSRGAGAGMAAGPIDVGWLCGARRSGSSNAHDGERICVDLDPDRPPLATHKQCRFELRYGVQQRSCDQGKASIVGDACTESAKCPSGAQCESGVCLPARPEPACWLDGDCGQGARCVLGSCAKAGA